MRKILNRPRPERRPQRLPIPKAELEEIWQRAWLEAARFQRIGYEPTTRPDPDGSWRVTASEELADPGQEHVERRRVHPAVGDDHVGVALARLDELLVAGPHGAEVLVDHALAASAPARPRPARGAG